MRPAASLIPEETAMWRALFSLADAARGLQGQALAACGFGPAEQPYRVLVAAERWRIREYAGGGDGPPLLIVAAPIKRPYIWDLAPAVSAVAVCLRHGFRVFLLEWLAPNAGPASPGLAEYVDRFIGEAVAAVSGSAAAKPFLLGHSLGGTLAAIHAAIAPDGIRGLVLLSAPLCFQPGSSRFRDAIIALIGPSALATDHVPGALVSQLSALACPEAFVWSRLTDAILSIGDPVALETHARIERWALDEVALPGRLFDEILQWLYRENRFCAGTLAIRDRRFGPISVSLPTLAVVNTADAIAPPASVDPFIEAMRERDLQRIACSGETGVGLQHLAILVGRNAHARIWPEIVAWLRAHD
jgi:polyhydroxyalkanoate synthase